MMRRAIGELLAQDKRRKAARVPWIERAKNALFKEKYLEAIDLANACLFLNVDEVEALYVRACSKLRQGFFGDAVEDVTIACRYHPKSTAASLNYSKIESEIDGLIQSQFLRGQVRDVELLDRLCEAYTECSMRPALAFAVRALLSHRKGDDLVAYIHSICFKSLPVRVINFDKAKTFESLIVQVEQLFEKSHPSIAKQIKDSYSQQVAILVN